MTNLIKPKLKNGGFGSGNWGHEGRPPEVGGSKKRLEEKNWNSHLKSRVATGRKYSHMMHQDDLSPEQLALYDFKHSRGADKRQLESGTGKNISGSLNIKKRLGSGLDYNKAKELSDNLKEYRRLRDAVLSKEKKGVITPKRKTELTGKVDMYTEPKVKGYGKDKNKIKYRKGKITYETQKGDKMKKLQPNKIRRVNPQKDLENAIKNSIKNTLSVMGDVLSKYQKKYF